MDNVGALGDAIAAAKFPDDPPTTMVAGSMSMTRYRWLDVDVRRRGFARHAGGIDA